MSSVQEDGEFTSSVGEIFDDLIDVADMNFDNQETWLSGISLNLKNGVDNLQVWLKSSPNVTKVDSNLTINDNKKFIDTRTWTRPKKKFSRMSFESIMEINSPINTFTTIENQCPNNQTSRAVEINLNEKTYSVPPILRPSILGATPFTTVSSGQESLEAFLNMSQTNGVDSFINMEVPEFNETLVNSSKYPLSNASLTYEEPQVINQGGMIDSQILTESMMQTSMFSEVSDVNINDLFVKDHSINVSDIKIPNYEIKPLNETLVKTTNVTEKKINLTFTTEELQQALDPSRSFIISNHTFVTDPFSTNYLSYIVDTSDNNFDKIDDKNSTIVLKENAEIGFNPDCDIDESFQVNSESPKLNSTFTTNNDAETCAAELNSTISMPNNDEKSFNHVIDATFTSDCQLKRRQTFRINQEDVKHRDSCQKTSSSSPPPPPAPPAVVNRFQTYRKSSVNRLKNPTVFTKVSNNFESKSNKQIKSCENLLDMKKDCSKVSRKLESNRHLSRLPQHLQKSNPNLVSNSLKTVNPGRISNFGFNYQKQAKNTVPLLTKRTYSLAKVNSGSEQRLVSSKRSFEFSKAAGSTESIESTQSAASAPDLDDRLSVCSDGSNSNSCRSGVNMEEIHKIGQNQQKNLKNESEPRRVLENTWFPSENNLPSPILKDTEKSVTLDSPCHSLDSTVITSSPTLNQSESHGQLLNKTISKNIETEIPVTAPPQSLPQKKIIENPKNTDIKSGIRPPSARGLSGIPRPASKIPAPKYTRPKYNKI